MTALEGSWRANERHRTGKCTGLEEMERVLDSLVDKNMFAPQACLRYVSSIDNGF